MFNQVHVKLLEFNKFFFFKLFLAFLLIRIRLILFVFRLLLRQNFISVFFEFDDSLSQTVLNFLRDLFFLFIEFIQLISLDKNLMQKFMITFIWENSFPFQLMLKVPVSSYFYIVLMISLLNYSMLSVSSAYIFCSCDAFTFYC